MTKFTSHPGGNHLILGGHRIRPDKNGDFNIPYKLLHGLDLSNVRVEARIHILYPDYEGQSPEAPIKISEIQVLDQEKVKLFADFYACPCRWRHKMDFEEYTQAVIPILEKESAANASFNYDGIEYDVEAKPAHIFSIETNNGPFVEIEMRLNAYILHLLKPLHDIRDAMDAPIQKQLII